MSLTCKSFGASPRFEKYGNNKFSDLVRIGYFNYQKIYKQKILEDESKENDAKIKEVIKLAQLTELVMSLPKGLDSLIGERGNKLSGGQRQRIALARALFRDSSILLFDEATSSLDHETESEIINSIKNLKGNKTIIIVAHKLSFDKICDRMIEISDGELINTVIY